MYVCVCVFCPLYIFVYEHIYICIAIAKTDKEDDFHIVPEYYVYYYYYVLTTEFVETVLGWMMLGKVYPARYLKP